MHRNLISLCLLRNDALSLAHFRAAVMLSPSREWLWAVGAGGLLCIFGPCNFLGRTRLFEYGVSVAYTYDSQLSLSFRSFEIALALFKHVHHISSYSIHLC